MEGILFIREQLLLIYWLRDMIYVPVSQELFIPVQPYYVVDEAQDLN
jgi:hypothetical protein